ncbi:MAG: tripartite tricarboxylate transporter TctB family protein, partial [Bacteroidota bacterium]|nr:tripartite tricarboxylate transporter TctB family protein [Bacteroidota bacterium]
LKIAGFELDKNANEAPYLTLFLFGIFIISFLIVYLVFKKKDIKINGTISILTVTGILSITFFYISSFFPAPREGLFVSSATVPKVWSIFLFIVSVIGLKLYYKNPTDETAKKGENVKSVISLSFLILAYITLISIIGFFISTGLFLISSMLIMRYKKYISLLLTTTLVLLFMYIVFIKILMVPLPIGSIF